MPRENQPIHITVPGRSTDPRSERAIPGVVLHHTPPLHPDDVTVVGGIAVTSPARTLIDLAEVADREELRELLAAAPARRTGDARRAGAVRVAPLARRGHRRVPRVTLVRLRVASAV